jgi:hypothetical protein
MDGHYYITAYYCIGHINGFYSSALTKWRKKVLVLSSAPPASAPRPPSFRSRVRPRASGPLIRASHPRDLASAHGSPRDLASAHAVQDSAASAPAAPLHHAASTLSGTAPPPRLLPSRTAVAVHESISPPLSGISATCPTPPSGSRSP